MNVDLDDWARSVAAEAAQRLTTRRLGRHIRSAGRVTSTMDEAAEWLAAGAPDGAVVIAASQSNGRGRAGRPWSDLPGASLLCSVVLHLDAAPSVAGLIPLAAGVAASEAVEVVSDLAPRLKWPNDVMLGERKVAGILVEGRAGGYVCGLGVNVGAGAADGAGAPATTLETEAGRPVSVPDLLAAFLVALEETLEGLAADDGEEVRRRWEERMHGRGRPVIANGGVEPVEGLALGLAPDGAMRVGTTQGERLVYAGDVTMGAPRDLRA